MILLAFVLVAIATVPLAGGALGRLLDLRLRLPVLAVVALAVQVLITTVVPEGDRSVRVAIHLGSYALVFAFLLANRRLPWMWMILLGGVLNFTAIAANGGVMPASEWALRTAGRPLDPEGFTNSEALEDPNLLFLGDVFAIPEPVPLANVFSIGDLLIGVGALLAIHRICGSRLGGATRTAEGRAGQV